MAVYSYLALDARGAEKSGSVEATDQKAALDAVRQLGLHPMSVEPRSGPAVERRAAAGGVRRRGRRVKLADLTLFTRQLSNLVRGGLAMMQTLDALQDNTENARLHDVLGDIKAQVSGGSSLHEAMSNHARVFPPLYLSLVFAGESSGELAEVLNRLADFMEQDLERRAQIRAALMYPALLAIVGTGIVFALVTFLIPRFKVLFDEFERALPVSTQVVLAVSNFLSHWWLAMLGGAILLRLVHRQWIGTPAGRLVWDRWRLHWPLFGKLHHRAATARLARTLATLLRGGVNILDALEILEGVVDNACLAAALRDIRGGVREGESLGLRARESGAFPGLLCQMMLVGEETGDMESALTTVADAFDVEVTNSLKGLVALIEPVIILVMGGIVAVVVISMLLPIFQLNEGIM